MLSFDRVRFRSHFSRKLLGSHTTHQQKKMFFTLAFLLITGLVSIHGDIDWNCGDAEVATYKSLVN